MPWIIWEAYQHDHITRRHQVSSADFEEAWLDPDRQDIQQKFHETFGPYFESLGYTADGRLLEMIWRWQSQDQETELVWPITAYFVD
jgi:hypothetical protein